MISDEQFPASSPANQRLIDHINAQVATTEVARGLAIYLPQGLSAKSLSGAPAGLAMIDLAWRSPRSGRWLLFCKSLDNVSAAELPQAFTGNPGGFAYRDNYSLRGSPSFVLLPSPDKRKQLCLEVRSPAADDLPFPHDLDQGVIAFRRRLYRLRIEAGTLSFHPLDSLADLEAPLAPALTPIAPSFSLPAHTPITLLATLFTRLREDIARQRREAEAHFATTITIESSDWFLWVDTDQTWRGTALAFATAREKPYVFEVTDIPGALSNPGTLLVDVNHTNGSVHPDIRAASQHAYPQAVKFPGTTLPDDLLDRTLTRRTLKVANLTPLPPDLTLAGVMVANQGCFARWRTPDGKSRWEQLGSIDEAFAAAFRDPGRLAAFAPTPTFPPNYAKLVREYVASGIEL